MSHHIASALISLASLACLASLSPASAQGATFQLITPAGAVQATDISADGNNVVGLFGTSGFRWNSVTGYQAVTGGEAWATALDGSLVVGVTPNLAAKKEAGLWTPGGGWVAMGNFGGSLGCDANVSNFEEVTPDGQWAAGMSWQLCKTWALRWNATTGFELLPKQLATASTRAICLSDDGLTVGGWETAAFGFRRGAVWMPDGSEVFPLTTAANPDGAGEIINMNSDGTVLCGLGVNNVAFRWTQAGGVTLLPTMPAFSGKYTAFDVSEDGSVVVGNILQGLTQTAWIWTPAHGTQTMLAYLQAKGVPGLTDVMLRGAAGVSDDGLTICGHGTSGAWLVQVASPWTDLGQGLAGTSGVPALAGSGTLQPESNVQLALTGALGGAPATLVVGFSQIDAPFKGGVLVPSPDLLLPGFVTDGSGEILLEATWPATVPSGFDTFFQWWIADAAGPKGFAASTGLRGTTP